MSIIVARTRDRRAFRLLVIIDEHTRECLAIYAARRITSDDVLGILAQLFVERGAPCYLRSDNGPEFTAKVVQEWLARVGVRTLYARFRGQAVLEITLFMDEQII